MPVSRSWARLMRLRDRETENARLEERRFRTNLWVTSNLLYAVGVMHQQPPETQREFRKRQKIEQGKARPDWARIEDARKNRDAFDEAMRAALDHPYNFEERFGFANPETGEGHLFPEPPPAPSKEDRRAYYERKNEESTHNVIKMLRMVQEGRKEGRKKGHRRDR